MQGSLIRSSCVLSHVTNDVDCAARDRVRDSGAFSGQCISRCVDKKALPRQTLTGNAANAEVQPWTPIKRDGNVMLPRNETLFSNVVDLDSAPQQLRWTGSSGEAVSGDEAARDMTHEAVTAATAAPV